MSRNISAASASIFLCSIVAGIAYSQQTQIATAPISTSLSLGTEITRILSLPGFDDKEGTRVLLGVELLSTTLNFAYSYDVRFTGAFPTNAVARVDSIATYNFVFPDGSFFETDFVTTAESSHSGDGPLFLEDRGSLGIGILPSIALPNPGAYLASGNVLVRLVVRWDQSIFVIRGPSRWSTSSEASDLTGSIRVRYSFLQLPCSLLDNVDPLGVIDDRDVLIFLQIVDEKILLADLDGSEQIDFFDVSIGLNQAQAGCP